MLRHTLWQVWHDSCQAFFQTLLSHLRALLGGLEEGAPVPEDVKQAVPIDLIRAVLPHATDAGRAELRSTLAPIS